MFEHNQHQSAGPQKEDLILLVVRCSLSWAKLQLQAPCPVFFFFVASKPGFGDASHSWCTLDCL